MKTNLIEIIAVLVFGGVSSVIACGCPENFEFSLRQRTESAIRGATAVFAGKVVGFEYKKDPQTASSKVDNPLQNELLRRYAKFEVTQWWKHPLTNSILAAISFLRLANLTLYSLTRAIWAFLQAPAQELFGRTTLT